MRGSPTDRTVPRAMVIAGSSGIGRSVAAALLDDGAEVVVVGRSRQRLEAVAHELGSVDRVEVRTADITVEHDVGNLFDEVGALDHVVVTAGRLGPRAARRRA